MVIRMSYYYSYFIGACNKNTGVFRVLGPFAKDEKNGKMRIAPVICKSQSFASDLHEEFSPIPEDKMSPEMVEQFTYKNYKDEPELDRVKYLDYSLLPGGEMIRSEYVLTSELIQYQQMKDDYLPEAEYFSETLSPAAYATFAQHYVTTGEGLEREVLEDEEYVKKTLTPDMYTLYRYIDESSVEFESWVIRMTVVEGGYDFLIGKDEKLVILETEG